MNEYHHEFSPSKLDRIAVCPGSSRATDSAETNEAAEQGKKLHAVMAGVGDYTKLTADEQGMIDKARDYERLIIGHSKTVKRENNLTLTDDNLEIVTLGTVDVLILDDNIAKIIDWKFGRVNVEGDSYQLKAYAAMVMQTYGVKTVEASIYQPLSGGSKPVLYTDFSTLYNDIVNVIDQAKRPDVAFIAGSQCKYCQLKVTCTAFLAQQGWLENAYKGSTTAIAERQSKLLADPDYVGTLAKRWKEIENVGRKIMKLCTKMTEAGQDTGWKLVERKGNRYYPDLQKVFDKLQDVFTHDEFLALTTIPVKTLEEAYIKNVQSEKDISAKGAKERLSVLLADLTANKPSSQTMKQI